MRSVKREPFELSGNLCVSAQPIEGQLRKDVGLLGIVTFGAGTAIGVSIFSILQPTSEIAGSGLLVAIGIAAVPMLLFAVAYAYLGSAVPVSGASYEWPSRFLHPFVGFMVGWLRIVSNVGAMTILSQVLISYLAMVVPMNPKLGMAIVISLAFGLNYLGVAIAAKVQNFLMLLLLLVLAFFVITGLPAVNTGLIGNPFDAEPLAVLAAVPLMISLFLGIEAAAEIGEEVRNPRRNIPLGIALAIIVTAVTYAFVAFTALGLIGPANLASSTAPLLDAAKVSIGAFATPLIVSAAAFSIFKSMNVLVLTFSRSLFAMGRDGVFPTMFGAIHPRFGTPHLAIALGYAFAMSGLLLPPSLVFLLLAINIPTMLKYLACSLAATRVATSYPELHARSQLRLAPWLVQVVGYLAALSALVIILLGIEADSRPYLLTGAWFMVGLAFWILRARRLARPGDVPGASSDNK